MHCRCISAFLVATFAAGCSERIAPAPTAAQAKVLQWVSETAHPVTTDATASLSDLDPLNAATGSAKVIGIGQSIAGASEPARIRRRLLEDLVVKQGVRTVIIDASPFAAEGLQEFASRDGPAQDSSGAFQLRATCRWSLMSVEFLETVKWIHTFNALHPADRIVIRGISVERPYRSYSSVFRLAERFRVSDVGLRDSVQQRLFKAFFYLDMPRAKDLECRYSAFLRNEPAATRSNVLAAMVSVYDTLAQSRSRLMAFERATAAEYDSALYDARQLVLWAQVEAGVVTRDAALAENLLWTLDHSAREGKAIVLAGNGEIGRTAGSLGQRLASAIGPQYFPIGLAGGDGEMNAVVGEGTQFDNVPSRTPLSLPPGGLGASHESLLQLVPMRAFLLDLRQLPPGDVEDWFATDRRLWRIDDRFTPKHPAAYSPLTRLSQAFDMLIWVRVTKPSRLM